MASDINRVTLIGRLTKDVELRSTQSGTSVASFSIANNKSYSSNGEKKEEVSYFNCTAWGKAGEIINQYMKKGDRIGIDGRLQQRSWQNKEGNKQYSIEVVVDNFQFLSSPKSTDQSRPDTIVDDQASFDSLPDSNPFSDDIPF